MNFQDDNPATSTIPIFPHFLDYLIDVKNILTQCGHYERTTRSVDIPVKPTRVNRVHQYESKKDKSSSKKLSALSQFDVATYISAMREVAPKFWNIDHVLENAPALGTLPQADKKKWLVLKRLHPAIREEQTIFLSQHHGSPDLSDSLTPLTARHPEKVSYSQELVHALRSLDWVARYPRWYSRREPVFHFNVIELSKSVGTVQPTVNAFHVESCVTRVGCSSKVTVPPLDTLPYPSMNIEDVSKLRTRFPPQELPKTPISMDETAKQCCVSSDVRVVLNASSLLLLLLAVSQSGELPSDLEEDGSDTQWDMPVIVTKVQGKCVVSVDSRLPPSNTPSQRWLTYLYLKYATRCHMQRPEQKSRRVRSADDGNQSTAPPAKKSRPQSVVSCRPPSASQTPISIPLGGVSPALSTLWSPPLQIDLGADWQDSPGSTAPLAEDSIPVTNETSNQPECPESPPNETANSEAAESVMEIPTEEIADEGPSQTPLESTPVTSSSGEIAYLLCQCLGTRFLLRHSVHGTYKSAKSKPAKTAHVQLKLEQQPFRGCEVLTRKELWKSWLALQRHDSCLIRVRVNISDGNVLLFENETLNDFPIKYPTFSVDASLECLRQVLNQLSNLEPGSYLLHRNANDISLYAAYAADAKKPGAAAVHDLHRAHSSWVAQSCSERRSTLSTRLPLDVRLLTVHHLAANTLPALYPLRPRDEDESEDSNVKLGNKQKQKKRPVVATKKTVNESEAKESMKSSETGESHSSSATERQEKDPGTILMPPPKVPAFVPNRPSSSQTLERVKSRLFI